MAKKEGGQSTAKQTFILDEVSEKKGSVKFLSKKDQSIDNIYIRRDALILKDGKVPSGVKVTIEPLGEDDEE